MNVSNLITIASALSALLFLPSAAHARNEPRDLTGTIKAAQSPKAMLLGTSYGEVRVKLASIVAAVGPQCHPRDLKCLKANSDLLDLDGKTVDAIGRQWVGKQSKVTIYQPASPHAQSVVTVGGQDVAVELARNGYVTFCANGYAPNQAAVMLAEKEARVAKRGVWAILAEYQTPNHCVDSR